MAWQGVSGQGSGVGLEAGLARLELVRGSRGSHKYISVDLFGGVAQVEERCVWGAEVTGSSPVTLALAGGEGE